MSGTAPAPCRGTRPHLLWVPNRGSYDPRRSTADQGQDGPHTPGDASGVLIRESPKLPLQGARCPVLGTPQQPLRGGVPGRAPRPHLPDHWREQLPGDWTPTCVTQGQVFSTHVPRCSEARGPPRPYGSCFPASSVPQTCSQSTVPLHCFADRPDPCSSAWLGPRLPVPQSLWCKFQVLPPWLVQPEVKCCPRPLAGSPQPTARLAPCRPGAKATSRRWCRTWSLRPRHGAVPTREGAERSFPSRGMAPEPSRPHQWLAPHRYTSG